MSIAHQLLSALHVQNMKRKLWIISFSNSFLRRSTTAGLIGGVADLHVQCHCDFQGPPALRRTRVIHTAMYMYKLKHSLGFWPLESNYWELLEMQASDLPPVRNGVYFYWDIRPSDVDTCQSPFAVVSQPSQRTTYRNKVGGQCSGFRGLQAPYAEKP